MSPYDPTENHPNNDGASHPRPANPLDRMPPHNIEAERGLLASVVLDNRAMNEVAMILKPTDFFRDGHAELFKAIADIADVGEPFDAVLVAERMGDRLSAIGGIDGLCEILNSVPHAANAKYYAQIVRQKALGRELIACSNAILRDVYSGDFTAEQLIESAEKRVFAIADGEAQGTTVDAADVVAEAMGRVALRDQGEVTGVVTGYPDLDDMTDGLQPGNLVIVAARPSQGKTAWALNVADHVSLRKSVATLFVSLEMNRQEVGERLLSSRSMIDSYKFKNPQSLSVKDRQSLAKAEGELRRARLYIDDTPMRSVTQIAANARRLKSRDALGLVIVDYIQLIDGQRTKGENRQEEVARISKRLKGLARELQVPVIALAQLNRESEKREDRRPRLSDLRESGQIEADADVVLLLHRPEYYDPNDMPGVAELIVAKNRNGATGTVKLTFMRHCTRFHSIEPAGLQGPIDDGPVF